MDFFLKRSTRISLHFIHVKIIFSQQICNFIDISILNLFSEDKENINIQLINFYFVQIEVYFSVKYYIRKFYVR